MARKKGKSTISQAIANYAIKVPVMPKNYLAGMTRFFEGANVSNSAPVLKYNQKIKAGVENIYGANLKRAFGL